MPSCLNSRDLIGRMLLGIFHFLPLREAFNDLRAPEPETLKGGLDSFVWLKTFCLLQFGIHDQA